MDSIPARSIMIYLRLWITSWSVQLQTWIRWWRVLFHKFECSTTSNTTITTKRRIIQGKTKDRPVVWAPRYLGEAYVALHADHGTLYHKVTAQEIGQYPVAWKYNVWDIVGILCVPITWQYSPSKTLSGFRKCGKETGAELWIGIKISGSTIWQHMDTNVYPCLENI